ncbi:transposase, partial [Myxococcota bacterium]|nr:transposase [Myxococcota bacterium]
MAVPVTIERCNTPNDLLHRLVREGLPELRRALEEVDRQLPRYVERELERFTTCGDPATGFAWLKCEACDHHRLVPFSCKGRGFCPSCGGRRMTERAARWVDELFPIVAVRQWVITVPWPRRLLLARSPELARGVLRVALQEIQRWLRRSTGQPRGRGGTVTVTQRFGSALNLNLHFHVLALDGLYCEDPNDGSVRWFRAPAPTDQEVSTLIEQIADRAEAFLARRGFGLDDEQDEEPDDALAVIHAAAVAGRSAVRRSRQARRVGVQGGRPYQLPPSCAHCDGYGLHAGVVIGAKDRKGLEGLARYIARPPLATPRLEELRDGRLRIRFKRPWSDGTEGVELSRIELIERLAALVPP